MNCCLDGVILWGSLGLFSGRLKAAGITCKSSIGSTPSCSHPVKDMALLSEVHPGNYAFYGMLVDENFVSMYKLYLAYGKKSHTLSSDNDVAVF